MNSSFKKRFKAESLVLPLILLGFLFIRIYDLRTESIWLDEAVSIDLASSSLTRIFMYPGEIIYHFFLKFWIGFFGPSEFSARFPSVIFGSLAVFMVYRIGRVIFDKETGIISSFLAGLSVFYIQYSQEARPYSLMLLLALASMYSFIRLMQKSKPVTIAGYLITNILLLYTHPLAALIPLTQSVFFFTAPGKTPEMKPPTLKIWLILQLPLYIRIVQDLGSCLACAYLISDGAFSLWVPRPAFISMPVSLLEFSGSFALLAIFCLLSIFSMLALERSGGPLSIRGFWDSLTSYQWGVRIIDARDNYLLLLWLVFPMFTLMALATFCLSIYWTRYLIICSPALYLLAARGIRNIRNVTFKSSLIAVICLFSLINIHNYWRNINKEPWRDAAAYIQSTALPKDSLVFIVDYAKRPFNYYLNRADLKELDIGPSFGAITEVKISLLGQIVRNKERFWVILYSYDDPRGLLKDYFNSNFEVLVHKEYQRTRFLDIRFHNFIEPKETCIELYLLKKRS